MHERPKIVAVGLLTQKDLNILGSGFRNAFPIVEGPDFDDLLRSIDEAVRLSAAREHEQLGRDRRDH